MSMLKTITLTGADEQTDIEGLVALVNRFPDVEIGLLYTTTPEDRPRYPSRTWIAMAAKKLSGRVAIHVCGSGARAELANGQLTDLTDHAPRVQVNGHVKASELLGLGKRVSTLITQHTQLNAELLGIPMANHALLLDGSGGRGISPKEWACLLTDKPVGFAGGIGIDNIEFEYERIKPLARTGAWTDMEGKLRVNGWFDLKLAAQCAEFHHDWVHATTA